MAARNCDICGTAYEAKRPNSRFCGDTCRQRAKRAGLGSAETLSPGGGSVARQARLDLDAMGKLDSTEGQAALALAGLLDAQKGAAGAAGTADRLIRIMDGLRKLSPAAKTPLDELRERRARRGA